jgi:signal transduction histidine kinase
VKDDDVLRGYLLEIKNGLHRMANIVKNLLACSRPEAVSVRRVNLNAAVEQALQGLKTEFLEKNVTVSKDLAPEVPEIEDYGLERVLSNLLRNSLDAVSPGGEITVESPRLRIISCSR